jgi:hypothetical protein
MRRNVLLTGMMIAAASPAMALKVTNLDTVPHTVRYEVTGTPLEQTVAPNQTVRFEGLPNGRLSLVSSPNPRTGSAVNADGILSGYIGNGRDQNMPVDITDEFVIWKGGEMQLQRRMKRYGRQN